MPRFLPDILLLATGVVAIYVDGTQYGGRRWGSLPRWIRAGSVAVFVLGLIVVVGLVDGQSWPHTGAWPWVSGLAMLWSIVIVVGTGLRFVLACLQRPYRDSRRRMLHSVARGSALAVPAAIITHGVVTQRRDYRVRELEITLPALSGVAGEWRILHLSDIHLSPFLTRRDLAYCVDLANSVKADLAVVTGDLITGVGDSVDDCLAELRRLKAPAGVLGCMGNHERYARVEDYVARAGQVNGIRFLRQEAVTIGIGGAKLRFAGVDYQAARRPYLQGAQDLLEPGACNILLSHNPDVFPVAARQGWDLTLAGHTHGGQVNVEILDQHLNAIRAFVTPYVYGHYKQGNSSIYVTRGIGTIGVPARLGAPPEIALLRLRGASA